MFASNNKCVYAQKNPPKQNNEPVRSHISAIVRSWLKWMWKIEKDGFEWWVCYLMMRAGLRGGWFEDLWWEMAWCECEKREGSAEWWKTGLDRQRRGEVVWARSEENCASKVTERASVWKRERECLCVGGRRRAGTEWSHKRVKVGNRDNQELAKEGVRRCFGERQKGSKGRGSWRRERESQCNCNRVWHKALT